MFLFNQCFPKNCQLPSSLNRGLTASGSSSLFGFHSFWFFFTKDRVDDDLYSITLPAILLCSQVNLLKIILKTGTNFCFIICIQTCNHIPRICTPLQTIEKQFLISSASVPFVNFYHRGSISETIYILFVRSKTISYSGDYRYSSKLLIFLSRVYQSNSFVSCIIL